MLQDLRNKNKKISVVGLGYVGLPIALEFGRKFSVVGFDIDAKRIESLKQKADAGDEVKKDAFENTNVFFTTDANELMNCAFHIVAVPTPVDEHRVPDLSPLISATKTVGKILKKGDYVIYESTVYPGCTEDICLPLLEELSGLKLNADFKLGYSPERINPGDVQHTLMNVIKIVSGSDDEALENIAAIYSEIVQPGVYKASSLKVAEAAKILENTQRDLNIALMNELSIILDRMNVSTHEVIEAAGTKWNFHKYHPGLVGGHCIGVDPYYLTYKSIQLGYEPEVILSGRKVNDNMALYVARRCLQKLIEAGKNLKDSKILVMGITFKENVTDIRNSKVADLINELKSFGLHVDVVDPNVTNEEVQHEYQFELLDNVREKYDAIIVAVAHKEYIVLNEDYFLDHATENCLLIDIKGIYRNKIEKLSYWTL
ncbi:MAG: nucleotide sugar dehydrogenase [Fimbriimonadaceae bacterium]|nr:nucleotide sugar dehydrogenase [Chitinophagales bacterium]